MDKLPSFPLHAVLLTIITSSALCLFISLSLFMSDSFCALSALRPWLTGTLAAFSKLPVFFVDNGLTWFLINFSFHFCGNYNECVIIVMTHHKQEWSNFNVWEQNKVLSLICRAPENPTACLSNGRLRIFVVNWRSRRLAEGIQKEVTRVQRSSVRVTKYK